MTYRYNIRYLAGSHETVSEIDTHNPVNCHDTLNLGSDYFLVMAVEHSKHRSTLWLGESFQSALECQLLANDKSQLLESISGFIRIANA
ncbi:MAG: hypothetical protein LRY38_01520 [Aeromonadaceae bacterium]|nr:hypothetical protein [Aeromonadaceae bacterium]